MTAFFSSDHRLAVAGFILSAVGLLVSIIGFGFGLHQLRRTQKATDAARVAIDNTMRTHLMFLVGLLAPLERELDLAIQANSSDLAVRALHGFTYTSHEILALVKTQELAQDKELKPIRQLADSAADAKNEIYLDSTKFKDCLTTFRSRLPAAISTVYSISASIQTENRK